MSGHRVVLAVVAATALAVVGAPGAGAAPDQVPGTVLAGMTQATDINNYDVVVGMSGWTPARWEPPGRVTLLPVPSGASSAYPSKITDSGFVMGDGGRDIGAGAIVNSALLWDPRGRLVDTQFPAGSLRTHAADINESGTVVGTVTDANDVEHAVRWDSDGRITELPALRGGTFSVAFAINNQGAAVGYSDVVVGGTHVAHAVYWDAAGRTMDLGGPFNTASSQAVDINNAGVIVGSRGDQVLRWRRLVLVSVLQAPAGFSSYWPISLNDAGVVLGRAHGYLGDYMAEHPIRWDSQGRVTDLGGGYHYHTWANAMNSSGTVVGTSDDGWHMPNVPRQSSALRWDPAGTMSYLNGPVGAWNTAIGINDRGVICGISGNTDGSGMQAVLWNRR